MAKILIAEDSATSAEILRRALLPLGHQLFVACDGEAADAAVDAFQPDLVLLDIALPKRNGFELCRQLRARPITRDIPIIAVTAMNRESDRFWGLKQGMTDYFFKPIDVPRLRDTVQSLLARPRPNPR